MLHKRTHSRKSTSPSSIWASPETTSKYYCLVAIYVVSQFQGVTYTIASQSHSRVHIILSSKKTFYYVFIPEPSVLHRREYFRHSWVVDNLVPNYDAVHRRTMPNERSKNSQLYGKPSVCVVLGYATELQRCQLPKLKKFRQEVAQNYPYHFTKLCLEPSLKVVLPYSGSLAFINWRNTPKWTFRRTLRLPRFKSRFSGSIRTRAIATNIFIWSAELCRRNLACKRAKLLRIILYSWEVVYHCKSTGTYEM